MLALGLDGIKRIVVRYGFQGKALLTDICIEAPAPRKGLVGWLDQPGFRKDRLPPLPRNTAEFAVGSFDPAVTCQKLVNALKVLEPAVDGQIDKDRRIEHPPTAHNPDPRTSAPILAWGATPGRRHPLFTTPGSRRSFTFWPALALTSRLAARSTPGRNPYVAGSTHRGSSCRGSLTHRPTG